MKIKFTHIQITAKIFLLLSILATTQALSITLDDANKETAKGSIVGKVLDKGTKQPLPNVNVQILGTNIGTVTDIDGKYQLKNLEEGIYKLKFSSVGFAQHIETEIRVIRSKTTVVKDIELKESEITIDGVEVTASVFSNDNVSPVTNFTYSREEIRRSPGAAGDIFRAIETLPGVSSSGGEFSTFAVRGGSPRDNIVLVDNIPFDKVSHFDGGTEEQEAQGGRFSIFSPGVIDEANFQAGGFAAKYGGKNASFVDLKIKEGNKESFTINGTYDLLGWEVNYDGPSFLLNNTSLLFSARHQDFEDVLKIMKQKEMGYPYFTDIILKTTTEISPQHKLSILGVYAPENFERNIDNVYEISNDNFDNILMKTDATKSLLGANWRWLTGSASYWENTLYYRGNEENFDLSRSYVEKVNGVVIPKEQATIRENYLVGHNTQNEIGWKSQFTIKPSALSTLNAGIQVSRIAFD